MMTMWRWPWSRVEEKLLFRHRRKNDSRRSEAKHLFWSSWFDHHGHHDHHADTDDDDYHAAGRQPAQGELHNLEMTRRQPPRIAKGKAPEHWSLIYLTWFSSHGFIRLSSPYDQIIIKRATTRSLHGVVISSWTSSDRKSFWQTNRRKSALCDDNGGGDDDGSDGGGDGGGSGGEDSCGDGKDATIVVSSQK